MRSLVAIHEAGHVVAAIALKRGFYSATIVPDCDSLGGIFMHYLASKTKADRAGADIKVNLAGMAAEQIATDTVEIPLGCESDLLDACRRLDRHNWSLRKTLESTRRLLKVRWSEVEVVAGALMTEKNLTSAEIRRILK